MGERQRASIEAKVTEIEGLSDDHCVTFSIASDEAKWVQTMKRQLNLHYPISDEQPGARILRAGLSLPGLECVSHDPGTFATFNHGSGDPAAVAAFIDGYFTDVLGAGDGYDLAIKLENLA